MQFIQDKEWYKVIRITGPTHNLLGLAFGGDGDETVVVHTLPSDERQAMRLNGDDVRMHVLDGVLAANLRFGTSYKVKQIQFVPTDSPPPDIYRVLAERVIERLVQKELCPAV